MDVSRLDIALVAIPMMIIAAVATHFTARAAITRQRTIKATQATPTAQANVMNALMLWVFPLGVLIGGVFLPVAILVYWLSNNAWTLVQQHLFQRMLDRAEAASPQ